MDDFQPYQRIQIAFLRPYQVGEDLTNVSVNESDRTNHGSPKVGDMIARNPKDHNDLWLVEANYFRDNFIPAK